MRRSVGWAACIALGLSIAIGMTAADEGAKAADEAKVFNYVGVDGCKLCHKTAKSGDQYGKWMEDRHSQAWVTLGTEEAKEVAKKAGVTGNPQEAAECLQCHVTAHGVAAERLGPKFKVEEGVGCESCHGPGSEYKDKKTMESHEASVAAGMIVPTQETCLGCHNEKNPTHKGFDYEAALKVIAHPTPEK